MMWNHPGPGLARLGTDFIRAQRNNCALLCPCVGMAMDFDARMRCQC